MKRKMRKRLVALVCVMSMLCAVCLNGMPALAGDGDSTATDITLENAPERFFSQWTFSDLGIEKQSVTDSGLNWNASYSGGSLDKTIFAGKINFKDNLSNLYIGGGAYWNGFLIQAKGTDGLVLSWSGSTDNTVIEFDYTTAKVTSLRNNSDLTVAFSFEYIHERVVNGVPYVDVNLGVFFNGNLYANTYYTFENIQKDLLKQDFRIYNNGNCGYDIESVALTDITFADAPESAFDAWSFSDLGIEDQNVTSNLNMAYTNPPYPAISSSLDKTVFRAKVNFSSSGMTAGGPTLFIGSGTDSDWRGLQLWAYGASVLALRYQYDDATVVMPVQFNSTTAEVNLFDNDVELAISIEYRNVRETEDGTFVDMRVGVFFGGKLYDNKYYTFADIPEEQLMQIAKMSVSRHSVAISSYPEKTITLDNAPERFFDEWTFKDAGVDNGDVNGGSLNWNATTSSQDLDRTIFHGKINFKDTLSNLYIGGNATWNGFCIQADGTNGLKITHQTSGQTVGTYNDTIAKTTLRNNSNLELSLSVEYLEETVVDDVECVNVKVGVFFDGVLYDNKYSEIKNVPKDKMRRNVKLYQGGNYYFASDYLSDITLANAPERFFERWTFADLGIDPQTMTGSGLNWGDGKYPAISTSLDKKIFNAKMKFDNSQANQILFVGGSATWQGFRLYPSAANAETLTFDYQHGSTAPLIATFNKETAGTTLVGNENLEISLSVEYVDVTDGVVTAKVGVFFDDKLYNNEYYTVNNIAESQLHQIVRIYNSKHTIGSNYLPDIKLSDVPERFFEQWTFKDAGVDNGDVNGGALNWNATTSSEDLDRTIFHGKINFKDTLSNLYIGGNATWYGFCIQADGANGLKITYQTSNQTVGTYNDTIAKTTLRNNSNLELSLSVEYLEETVVDDVECVNVKVGVFFDGVLYDSKYCEIKNVPKAQMRRNVKLYQGGNYYFASDYLPDITLANAPEAEFDYWTFSDFGIANGPLTTSNINWTDNTIDYPSIGASLDHTIFHTKVLFPTTDFGFLTIGGMDDNEVNETESHKYRGFQIYPNDATGLILKYQYSNSSAPTIATFDATTAETTLRGEDVQLSLSVEYLDIDDSGNVTMKVGVFFNGKLYDNKYYIVEQAGITEDQLTQIVRYRYNSNGVPIITSVEKSINVASECNGGTVIVSHVDQRAENDGYGMSNLIDTVTSPKETYYRGVTDSSLENETMTFEFRFDDVYSVDMVQMVGRTSVGGFPKNFTVSAYTVDGWKDVLSQTDYEMTKEQNKFMFDAVDCTAVRLTTTEDGVCLSEFEVYGVSSNADVAKPQSFTQNATSLSIGKNSIAITDGIYTGNDGYRALEESATHKVDVQLIFQQVLQADGVTFYSQEAGEFPSAFDIYAFTGSTWEKVYSATDYQPNESRIMHQFNFEQAVSCSSMILVVNELYDLYGSYGMQLQEVCVNAVEGTSSISLLGDGNTDGMLTEADDMQALRQAAVGKVEATSVYDINNDAACSSFDLIRMKRYFATEPTLTKQHDITSMSFNVLGVSAQSGMQDPTVRAPKIAEYILEQDLDLVGLQEAGYQGYHVLNKPDGYDSYEDYDWTTNFADLICEGGYAAIKISDDQNFQTNSDHYTSQLYGGGNVPISAGLMMFYKTSRFDLIGSGAQKYTSTESQERWFQWAKLLDKQSGEIVYMTNTHWSIDLDADGNASETAGDEHRTKQSNELLAFWKNTVGDNLLVATGDYNCASPSEWLQSLGSDVYKEAGSSLEVLDAIGSHIDHIFVNANQATVETCHFKYDEFVLDGTSCRYSDHYPMFVRTSYISD